jgi:thiamine biosynthesis lipoprotein
MHRLHRTHRAMATEFEAILVGDDLEHLDAVCTAAFEEIDRVERLLSRFDPASEVYRVNREAAQRPVKVSVELAGVIEDSRQWFRKTDGFFDVTISSRGHEEGADWSAMEFDLQHRTLAFLRSDLCLDFGGFAKGYALDRVGEQLIYNRVHNYFIHGGTSSIAALGREVDGECWQFDLPSGKPARLIDRHASTSEVTSTQFSIEPMTITCTVIAPTGAAAECLSTALLLMGMERACRFLREMNDAELRIYWTDRHVKDWIWPIEEMS